MFVCACGDHGFCAAVRARLRHTDGALRGAVDAAAAAAALRCCKYGLSHG